MVWLFCCNLVKKGVEFVSMSLFFFFGECSAKCVSVDIKDFNGARERALLPKKHNSTWKDRTNFLLKLE